MFHPATPALQARASETLRGFSLGCAVDLLHNDTLAPCCAAVGSTPAELDGVFGYPYNAAFAPAANQSFAACAMTHGARSICAASQNNDASQKNTGVRLRWNGLPAALLLAGILAALGA
ncbi:hypothetical protein DFH09DRAFT_1085480 [Mycena vulgaris]|nr:hypothetical protein DFH09DRAFT_1085480 [Mycena vulgaris]